MALDIYTELSNLLGVSQDTVVFLLLIILLWKTIWYGFAIYKSLERKQKPWFVVLFVGVFVLNDFGLLAIIYLLLYQEKRTGKTQIKPVPKPKKKR